MSLNNTVYQNGTDLAVFKNSNIFTTMVKMMTLVPETLPVYSGTLPLTDSIRILECFLVHYPTLSIRLKFLKLSQILIIFLCFEYEV